MSTELALGGEMVLGVDSAKTKTKTAKPCRFDCPQCAQPVLRGRTRATESKPSVELILDPWQPAYCVIYETGAEMPTLVLSSGYPVHRCGSRSTGEGAA
jgi:hypothetical protein